MNLEKQFDDIIKNNNLSKDEKLASILKIIVDTTHIKPKSYMILGSYALRNYRTISDLDVNMDSDEFEKLKTLPFGRIELYNNQIRWFYDMTDKYKMVDPSAEDFSIEIFKKKPTEGFPNSDFSLEYLNNTNGLNTDKYGHQFFSMNTLLAWKKAMNRPKDLDDIKLIESKMNITGGYYWKYRKYKSKYIALKNNR